MPTQAQILLNQKTSLAKMMKDVGVSISNGNINDKLWLKVRYIRQMISLCDAELAKETVDTALVHTALGYNEFLLGRYLISGTVVYADYHVISPIYGGITVEVGSGVTEAEVLQMIGSVIRLDSDSPVSLSAVWAGSQIEYDDIVTKNPNTIYFIQ